MTVSDKAPLEPAREAEDRAVLQHVELVAAAALALLVVDGQGAIADIAVDGQRDLLRTGANCRWPSPAR